MKKILITLSEGLYERIENYREENDLVTVAETIRAMLVKASTKPAYVTIQEKKLNAPQKTEDEKELDKARKMAGKEKAKQAVFLEGRTAVCLSIGGKVTEDGYCEYPRYQEDPGQKVTQWTERIPLEELKDDSDEFIHITLSGGTKEERKAKIESLLKLQK